MPPTPRAAALLDVDGTLVDTTYHHALAWWRACIDGGIPTPLWRLHRLIGMGADQLVQEVAGEERPDLEDRWIAHFDDMKPELRALPGAGELVRALSERGLRVLYATSGREDDVGLLRDLVGADEFVDGVVNSSEVEASKPAPDIFALALQRAEVPPDRALVVGDTVWDVKAAAACGLSCIGVRSGGIAEAELREAGAVAVYEDAAALAADLDQSCFASLWGGDGA